MSFCEQCKKPRAPRGARAIQVWIQMAAFILLAYGGECILDGLGWLLLGAALLAVDHLPDPDCRCEDFR